MKTYNCHGCGIEVEWTWNKLNKYCSLKCQGATTRRTKIDEWIEGKVDWRRQAIPQWIKDRKGFLAQRDDYKCSICGIDEWMGKPLNLECDHIDGNRLNNRPENLRLICSNCHSQTATFKGRNKSLL